MENKETIELLTEIKEILKGVRPITSESDQVYDVPAAAAFLHLSESTLYYYLDQKLIPHKKIGKHYRMLRSQLIDWLLNDKAKVITDSIQSQSKRTNK